MVVTFDNNATSEDEEKSEPVGLVVSPSSAMSEEEEKKWGEEM